jgi:hypothetical protein
MTTAQADEVDVAGPAVPFSEIGMHSIPGATKVLWALIPCSPLRPLAFLT